MYPLILASSSPRRRELLQFLQIPFQSVSTNTDESIEPGTLPADAVRELALRKARAAADSSPGCTIIGSDTVVVLDGQILGKPAGREEAAGMLKRLSGRVHSVFTGVALLHDGHTAVFSEETKVSFFELQDADIERYLDTGEPFDKAGSYGIQGYGSLFVEKIEGDYFTVVGLPVARLNRELKAFWTTIG